MGDRHIDRRNDGMSIGEILGIAAFVLVILWFLASTPIGSNHGFWK